MPAVGRHALHVLALSTTLITIPTPGFAADYPKEGRIDTVECFVAEGPRVESSSGVVFGNVTTHSVAYSPRPSGSPFDSYGSFCVAVYVERKDGPSTANGYCEQTDSDGDKWLIQFVDDGNDFSGRMEFIGGTGKYVGAKITGEFKPLGPTYFGTAGHAQQCTRVTGTYKLK